MADSIADAWSRGMVAGADGWPARDNPYPLGTSLAESWRAGWLMGQDLCPPPWTAERLRETRHGEPCPPRAVRSRLGGRT